MKTQLALCLVMIGLPLLSQEGQTPSQTPNIQSATEGYQSAMEKLCKKYKDEVEQNAKTMKDYSDGKMQEGDEIGNDHSLKIKGHFEMRRWEFIMGVPELTMEDKDIVIDVPKVIITRRGVSMHTPIVKMQRVEGPSYPEYTTEWRNDGLFGTPSPTVTTK